MDVVFLVIVFSFLAAFIYHVYLYRCSRRQAWVRIFSNYALRYSDIMSEFPGAVSRDDFSLAGLDEGMRERFMKSMRSFFYLCSEEYFLGAEKGWLPSEIWSELDRGISEAMRRRAFREAWSVIRDGMYYGEFRAYVDGLASRD